MMADMIITIICSVMASSGLWAFISSRLSVNEATRKMILGLGHDRIIYLGMHYLERGDWITQDEYENLHDYLYIPYAKLNGNGTGKKIMEEVKRLRIVKEPIK